MLLEDKMGHLAILGVRIKSSIRVDNWIGLATYLQVSYTSEAKPTVNPFVCDKDLEYANQRNQWSSTGQPNESG